MAQEPNKLREHIDARRARLGNDLEEIEHRMKDAVDWRVWYRKNTVAMLGAAVAGGFLLSMALGRSSSNRSEPPVENAENVFTEESDGKTERRNFRESPIGSKIGHHVSRLTDIADNMAGAFLGLAGRKLQEFVSRSIPGFKEQYSEAERRRSGL